MEMKRSVLNTEAKKIQYDPSLSYEWDPTDLFTVTGAEIDIWNKALMTQVNTVEFQRFAIMQAAAIKMNTFIKEAVEEGLIKQKKPDISKATEIATGAE